MPAPTKDRTDVEPSICHALRHPIRARILEIVNELPISAGQFVRQGLVPDEFFENYQQAELSISESCSAAPARVSMSPMFATTSITWLRSVFSNWSPPYPVQGEGLGKGYFYFT